MDHSLGYEIGIPRSPLSNRTESDRTRGLRDPAEHSHAGGGRDSPGGGGVGRAPS